MKQTKVAKKNLKVTSETPHLPKMFPFKLFLGGVRGIDKPFPDTCAKF